MPLSRRQFLAACGGVIAAAQQAPKDARPNFVILLADDQGWGDLSIHGNTNLATPNIDTLARDGTLFDRFYVCPVCAPTRAEFMTGRYHAPILGTRSRKTIITVVWAETLVLFPQVDNQPALAE